MHLYAWVFNFKERDNVDNTIKHPSSGRCFDRLWYLQICCLDKLIMANLKTLSESNPVYKKPVSISSFYKLVCEKKLVNGVWNPISIKPYSSFFIHNGESVLPLF